MEIKGLKSWGESYKRPLLIAGPCSAETEEQLYDTAKAIKQLGINIIRAGVWKPRTRPNSFEGMGIQALKWIRDIKSDLGVSFATEVASPVHVQEALYHGVDVLWIGARSTVNPFTVQDIADSLKGVDNPVFVKNPVNPDLSLWIGAIERIQNAGVKKIGAIHRGFSSYQKTRFRNQPNWRIPLDLKKNFPYIPLICDPSHIAGQRSILQEVSQRAADLDFDGLIIETHRDPDNAWSDAKQQITPERLGELLNEIRFRKPTSRNKEYIIHLEEMREQIDHLDYELFEVLSSRMKIVDQIGHFKKNNNVTIFQKNRWKEIMDTRSDWAKKLDLSPDFAEDLFKLIHENAIRRQDEIMNKDKKKKKND